MDTIRKSFILTALWVLVHFGTVHAQSLLNVLENNDDTQTFALAVKKCGLEQKLDQDGPFTLLVPADERLERILETYDESRLRNLVMNHIMTGMATKNSIQKMTKITTLGGLSLLVKVEEHSITLNNSTLITSNIKARNGVIHIIDRVLY